MSGAEGAAKGPLNEQRLVDLLNNEPRPLWLLKASKASEGMDRQGIDVEVVTDVGTLYLQVKSSQNEAKRFRRRYKRRMATTPVAVVILQEWKSLEDVRKQALAVLNIMRRDRQQNTLQLLYYLPKRWRKINEHGEFSKINHPCRGQ